MKKLTYLAVSISIATSIALQGCVSSPDRQETAKTAVNESLGDVPTNWSSIAERVGTVESGWLSSLNDPLLTSLVMEAQKNNYNLQAAAQNVNVSRALVTQAGSALSPQLGFSTGGSDAGALEGSSSGSLNANLQASWELDIWGRLAAGENAAVQSLKAAEAEYVFTQYSLAAGVSKAYFVSIEAIKQTELTQMTFDAVAETMRITKVQFDNGLADQQDIALAKAEVASAEDALIASKGAQRDAIRSLELLLGRYPSAELTIEAKLPNVPAAPSPGIPSELLERRPDLIAAERQVAAAFNKLDQAQAAKLPSVSLTGSLGGSSSSLSSLLNPANLAWQAIGSIAAPILDGGRLDAQVEAANAEQKAAVASYAQTALSAFSDVETALDLGQVLRQREVALVQSLESSEEALRIANLRYQEGETSLLEVLQIQQRVFSARRNVLSINRALLTQFIDLNLALGGNWQ
ncbi:efflux transporter outer membrane subunit [Glaciecola petra]|uniref:Efflux transporter outer membrane subunit n=1 Tax=Glaciecola petra TaxID=3075602 RepID=A0ABU2ZQC1_9ALTE|nr:efflux transporter outer membrane subunit [Aestuariibacter sp. P117]MDT0594534.1 efflux transporter outer membrane subunit [Aestuariibacter sp. P117]